MRAQFSKRTGAQTYAQLPVSAAFPEQWNATRGVDAYLCPITPERSAP